LRLAFFVFFFFFEKHTTHPKGAAFADLDCSFTGFFFFGFEGSHATAQESFLFFLFCFFFFFLPPGRFIDPAARGGKFPNQFRDGPRSSL